VPDIGELAELHRLVAAARVARLATVRPDGAPRLVPITFALLGTLVCSAVDDVKPKRSIHLARLADVARDPRTTLLVDHYDEDWQQLWWVRIEGTASVHTGGALHEGAVEALARKYPAYRARRPTGPVLVVHARRWTGWSAR
jgi:PPOX class probable F420-dependent enzyme